jgi:hypothetical protein
MSYKGLIVHHISSTNGPKCFWIGLWCGYGGIDTLAVSYAMIPDSDHLGFTGLNVHIPECLIGKRLEINEKVTYVVLDNAIVVIFQDLVIINMGCVMWNSCSILLGRYFSLCLPHLLARLYKRLQPRICLVICMIDRKRDLTWYK